MVWALEEVHTDLADGRARARADIMCGAFDDALVMGWEPLVDGIVLPDADDRHVVAAAQRGRADLIVTANLADFPSDVLDLLCIEVQSPDVFLVNQLDLDPDRVVAVLYEQAAATRNPSITFDQVLHQLSRCGVPEFVKLAHQQRWRALNG